MTTIKQLGRAIKILWPSLDVVVRQGYCNTDRHIGRNLRHPGKGRKGSHITVTVRCPKFTESRPCACDGNICSGNGVVTLLNHNNAETYRYTGEVRNWISERLREHPPEKGTK